MLRKSAAYVDVLLNAINFEPITDEILGCRLCGFQCSASNDLFYVIIKHSETRRSCRPFSGTPTDVLICHNLNRNLSSFHDWAGYDRKKKAFAFSLAASGFSMLNSRLVCACGHATQKDIAHLKLMDIMEVVNLRHFKCSLPSHSTFYIDERDSEYINKAGRLFFCIHNHQNFLHLSGSRTVNTEMLKWLPGHKDSTLRKLSKEWKTIHYTRILMSMIRRWKEVNKCEMSLGAKQLSEKWSNWWGQNFSRIPVFSRSRNQYSSFVLDWLSSINPVHNYVAHLM